MKRSCSLFDFNPRFFVALLVFEVVPSTLPVYLIPLMLSSHHQQVYFWLKKAKESH